MRKTTESFKNIRLLYLCERHVFLYRTSRGRFHAVRALQKYCNVVWSGPGWENWDAEKTLDENIAQLFSRKERPHFIFCYKPFAIKGFSQTDIPVCVSYMEMTAKHHSASYTIKEILENHIDLVFCYHLNEMNDPAFRKLPCKMVYNPHCIDPEIFKDYQLTKDVDVLLVGIWQPQTLYPFRTRLKNLIYKMRVDPRYEEYRIGIRAHPGKTIFNAPNDEQMIAYAKEMNRAKICLTCSGRYRTRFAKYAEIPACRSLLMGDFPDENQAFFRQFAAEINNEETDEEIEEKILYYLQHDEERAMMTDIGYELTRKNYTWDHYAEKFLMTVAEFLREYKGKKLPVWNSLS